MALYVQQNRHFVMRLPRDYTTEVKQFLASGKPEETREFAAKSSHSRLMCSESGTDPNLALRLRIIRVELETGETELLLTSLLDAQAYPVEQFAGLYNRRWGIETDFRRTKITLGLDNFQRPHAAGCQTGFPCCPAGKESGLVNAAFAATGGRSEAKRQQVALESQPHTGRVPHEKQPCEAAQPAVCAGLATVSGGVL